MLDRALELKLALLAKDGDQAAFGTLYNTYIRKIYDFIYFKTLNKEVAEDLSSQVFLKALKHITNFHSDNFAAWLYTIARHTVIDHYRSDKNYKNIEDCWDLADLGDLVSDANAKLLMDKVKLAMQKLSASDREILTMRLWADMPFKEIADILGKRESAAKVAFGRALDRLRREIAPALLILASLIIWKRIS
jgi:RNA polymerase sigma-70 factor (ECF subfamily)